ncbi:MAG: DUF4105 domain-containing protein [Bacteroidota bacterium]|nr:DUF4105 domain-containing protein [Bacteroidota bacterium]
MLTLQLKNIRNIAKINFLLLAALFIFSAKTFAQQDSCHVRISILTATPGEELYSTFGHSALRVYDTISNQDIVYNYGTFNFDEPDFYMKFIRGKLSFYLSTDNFENFKSDYEQDKRGITEQVLNLTCAESYNINRLLRANMMEHNRVYKYDFTFDNCTTRLRDLVEKATDSTVHFGKALKGKASFRDLIYEYLNYNDKQWSKLGIDILLGSKLDLAMEPRQVMFLPDYLMKTFDSSTIDSRPLVSHKNILIKPDYSKIVKDNLTHPFFIFSCLFVLIAFLSFSNNLLIQKFLFSLDGFLFFITGILGVLLIFMWFGTDHIMCKNNYNLLWAWPINVVAAFYIHSKKKIAKNYFLIYAIFNLLLIVCWFFLPQHMNPALIPIILILITRSFVSLSRKKI